MHAYRHRCTPVSTYMCMDSAAVAFSTGSGQTTSRDQSCFVARTSLSISKTGRGALTPGEHQQFHLLYDSFRGTSHVLMDPNP